RSTFLRRWRQSSLGPPRRLRVLRGFDIAQLLALHERLEVRADPVEEPGGFLSGHLLGCLQQPTNRSLPFASSALPTASDDSSLGPRPGPPHCLTQWPKARASTQ